MMYACDFCFKTLHNKNNLNRHQSNMHPNNDEDAAWPKFEPGSLNTQILDRNIYSASHPSERLCEFLFK